MTKTPDSKRICPTVSARERHIPCRLHGRRIRTSVDLPAISETFSRQALASIIGGNATKAGTDGFSYWAAEPKDVFEFWAGDSGPFEKLEAALARYALAEEAPGGERMPEGMFRGGWIGYFSYDLGRYIESLPQTTIDDLHMPLIRLCFYDRLIACDHRNKAFWALALELPDDEERPEAKIATLERLLEESRRIGVLPPRAADIERVDLSKIQSNMTRDAYLRAIDRTQRYILDGEVYQVNLSQRFKRPFTGRPIDLFHWENHYNPCPYAAYLDTGTHQIASASPEMFITLRDGMIETEPIKGTRPRRAGDDPRSNRINTRNFNELLTSEKEQAELNMIIDLERNDIARICKPGTRHVVKPRTIKAYPTVFHAVATVGGELRPDAGFGDILKAVFPGGSITGAPKIRSMEIIDELEPTARGLYTGSIGYIGLDSTACLNIAIRTVIITDQMAFVQTGGGIVADSEPGAEWEETITKARALLAGIEAAQEP